MFEVLKFIINCILQFCAMLFTIDVGFTSLGIFMCIIFIFLPLVLTFVGFLKATVISELDDRYDESRPTEIWQSNEHLWNRSPGSNRNYGRSFSTNHIRTRKRRYKL